MIGKPLYSNSYDDLPKLFKTSSFYLCGINEFNYSAFESFAEKGNDQVLQQANYEFYKAKKLKAVKLIFQSMRIERSASRNPYKI